MTTPAHDARMERIRHLARAEAAKQIQTPDGVCSINGGCKCPTCGVIKALIDGQLAAYCKTAKARVRVMPPEFEASYPYRARVLVDHREIYRVHDRPEEVLDESVRMDLIRALGGPERC